MPSAAAALVVVGAVAWLVVTMVGANSPHAVATTTTSAPPPPTTSTTTTVPVTTTTTTVPVTTTTTPEGALPQTDAEPSSASPQFQAAMAELFDAVAHGTPPSAGPAFFPEAAYDQLKTIRYPASDWQYRLLAEYDEDLAAATTSLGPDPVSATLVSVQVPM